MSKLGFGIQIGSRACRGQGDWKRNTVVSCGPLRFIGDWDIVTYEPSCSIQVALSPTVYFLRRE